MLAEIKKDTRTRMGKSLEALRHELAKIRTGRAHPSLLEHIHVDYYGSQVPISQAANVTVDGVDPAVATNATFGTYIERMGKDYAKFSKTPDQYNAFVEQISKMWASEPAWTKEQLAAIKVPTAIVLGDHDEAITRVHTDYMAATIPGAKLIILKDASHFAMLQDPAGYTKAVLDFLGGM